MGEDLAQEQSGALALRAGEEFRGGAEAAGALSGGGGRRLGDGAGEDRDGDLLRRHRRSRLAHRLVII